MRVLSLREILITLFRQTFAPGTIPCFLEMLVHKIYICRYICNRIYIIDLKPFLIYLFRLLLASVNLNVTRLLKVSFLLLLFHFTSLYPLKEFRFLSISFNANIVFYAINFKVFYLCELTP